MVKNKKRSYNYIWFIKIKKRIFVCLNLQNKTFNFLSFIRFYNLIAFFSVLNFFYEQMGI